MVAVVKDFEPLLVTEVEAAKALAISPKTLWRLRKSGEIPAVLIGRAVRYSTTALVDWIERRQSRDEILVK